MLEESKVIADEYIEPDIIRPANVLGCVDEINRMVCLLAGLKHMLSEVLEDAPLTGTQERRMIQEAYSGIVSREMKLTMNQLEIVADVLMGEVKRRRRFKKAIYTRLDRHNASPKQ